MLKSVVGALLIMLASAQTMHGVNASVSPTHSAQIIETGDPRPATTSSQPNWTQALEIDLGTDEIGDIAFAGGYLWVAESWQSGRLFKVDPTTGNYSSVNTGSSGLSIQAFQGRLFMVGSSGENPGMLAELSPDTGEPLNRVRVCPGDRNGPTNFWIDASEIAVACKSGTFSVSSTSTLQELRRANFGQWLTGTTRVGDEYWVGSYGGTVTILDAATLNVKRSLDGCPEAWGLWAHNGNVICQGLANVVAYNAGTRERLWITPAPASGYDAYMAMEGLLISGYEDGRIGLIDTETGAFKWRSDLNLGGLIGVYYDSSSVWVGDREGVLRKYSRTEQPPMVDSTPPTVSGIRIPANVKQGTDLVAEWELTDTSGIESASMWVQVGAIPGEYQGTVAAWCPQGQATQIGETATRVRFSRTCTLPVSIRTGEYSVHIQATDRLGNSLSTSIGAVTVNSAGAFNGTFTPPPREGGTARIVGEVTIPEGAECSGSLPYQQCWLVAYSHTASGRLAKTFAITRPPKTDSFTRPGTYVIEAHLSFLPAEDVAQDWTVVLAQGTAAYGPQYVHIGSFTLPYRTTSKYRTMASIDTVVSGSSVTFSATIEQSWSDNQLTTQPINSRSTLTLEHRPIGSTTWTVVGQGNSVTVQPETPGEWRYLVDGQVAETVFVNVIRPTSSMRITDVSATPLRAVRGGLITFSASVEALYEDDQWRKAPAGTRVDLQYRSSPSTPWTTLTRQETDPNGKVVIRWTLPGPGEFSLRSGVGRSSTLLIQELPPGEEPGQTEDPDGPGGTGTFSLGPIEATATSIRRNQVVRFSARVTELMRNGSVRPAQDGLAGNLEVLDSGRWINVKAVRSRNGTLDTRVRVTMSGNYRFRLLTGEVSTSIRLTVTRNQPDRMVVKWPQRASEVLRVKLVLKQGSARWNKRERVTLQVRPTGSGQWQTVDRASTRNGRATLSTQRLMTGTWRVTLQRYGLEDAKVYGAA